jgi:oligopeptide/dipeptide ABC transporter ATP-binding protein
MRRKLQMIFQDPYASLNPRMTVAEIVAEPLDVYGVARGEERQERVEHLLRVVGLSPYFARRLPHEFSGGQRQRIGLARALALNPIFVICDELGSQLEPAMRARLLDRLKTLQRERGLTYLLLARSPSELGDICDRVAVMYRGKLMELSSWDELNESALHPYTQALLSVGPAPYPSAEAKQPGPANPRVGCPYNVRCPLAIERCYQEAPAWRELRPNHWAYCHRADEALNVRA